MIGHGSHTINNVINWLFCKIKRTTNGLLLTIHIHIFPWFRLLLFLHTKRPALCSMNDQTIPFVMYRYITFKYEKYVNSPRIFPYLRSTHIFYFYCTQSRIFTCYKFFYEFFFLGKNPKNCGHNVGESKALECKSNNT